MLAICLCCPLFSVRVENKGNFLSTLSRRIFTLSSLSAHKRCGKPVFWVTLTTVEHECLFWGLSERVWVGVVGGEKLHLFHFLSTLFYFSFFFAERAPLCIEFCCPAFGQTFRLEACPGHIHVRPSHCSQRANGTSQDVLQHPFTQRTHNGWDLNCGSYFTFILGHI